MRTGPLAALLSGSRAMKRETGRVEPPVGGSPTGLLFTWREGSTPHRAGTPWTHEDGASLAAQAWSPRAGAAPWMRVLEEGRQVRGAPKRRREDNGVWAQVDGVVVAW